MGIGSIVHRILGHPLAQGVRDVDDPSCRIPVHRQLIQSKPLLREGYLHWYEELLPAYRETAHLRGEVVEVGCGPGFLEEFIPGLVKTDSVPNPFAHRIMDAMQMDYPDCSLRAICAVGVVHHLPHPDRFLAEAQRCLEPGGRLALVEPSNHYPVPGFPKRLFELLDHYEYFDASVESWDNEGAGNMRGANIALPWVIFERDRAKFDARFPSMKIRDIRYHSSLSHILAGGFSLRSFVPRPAIPSVFALERALSSFLPKLGAMMTIDVEKT
jgi:SAM-dependent methyltransferase